jgi:hypothetical protein
MIKDKSYKKTFKKMLKTDGHSNTTNIMLRLKSSKERDYLVDTKQA